MLKFARASGRLHPLRMPAFTLYGARGSTNTDRVRLTLAEGGFTDYELVFLDLVKGEHKSPEYLKLNPWGTVPTLKSADGFTLYESRAISRYIAKKCSFRLLPPKLDLEANALFDQALSVETMNFADPAGKLGFEKFAKRFLGLPTDEAMVANAEKSLERFLNTIDRQLSCQEYMAGKDFTLVDIFYIPTMLRLFACGYEETILSRPAVKTWWERCVNRPAIAKMLAADREAFMAFMTSKQT